MKFKIIFIDVGRSKHNSEIIQDFKDLDHAQIFAFEHVKKYLLSSEVSLTKFKNNIYTVWAGFHTVGKVIIEKLK